MKKIFIFIVFTICCINVFAQTNDFEKYILPLKNADLLTISNFTEVIIYANAKDFEVAHWNKLLLDEKFVSDLFKFKGELLNPIIEKYNDIIDTIYYFIRNDLPKYKEEYDLSDDYVNNLNNEFKDAYLGYSLLVKELERYLI